MPIFLFIYLFFVMIFKHFYFNQKLDKDSYYNFQS